MEEKARFFYRYSATENKEIQEIRKKYLPQEENKLDELKRLDRLVQSSGMAEALSAGIGGLLVFGLGLCLAMQVIGTGIWLLSLGVLLGILGMLGIFSAYPLYRSVFGKTKARYAPRILQLTAELSGESNSAS